MIQKKVSEILENRRQRAKLLKEERVRVLYQKHPKLKQLQNERRLIGQEMILRSVQQQDTSSYKEKLEKLAKQEKSYWQEIGIDEHFFEPDYFCKNCEDTGFIEGKSCHCRKQLQMEANYDMSEIHTMLKEQNFDTFDIEIFRKNRQPNEPMSPYDNMRELQELMKDEYVPFFSQESPNLYIYGPTGTGKTFLVNSIAKGVLDKGHTVLYQTAPALMDFLVEYSFMYHDQRVAHKDRKDFCYDADLLIIDDLGTEYLTAKMNAELFELINARLVAKKPIIISSNIQMEELGEIYDERIASRIYGNYQTYEIFGNDLRWQR